MGTPGCIWFCLKRKPKVEEKIFNEKVLEKRCELYSKTMNTRLEAVEKRLDAKCVRKEVKQIGSK